MSLASKKTRYTLDLELETEDDDEYLKEATPGPGYYHNSDTFSTFKSSQKPKEFQIFSSGSERFPRAKKNIKVEIGPGKYH